MTSYVVIYDVLFSSPIFTRNIYTIILPKQARDGEKNTALDPIFEKFWSRIFFKMRGCRPRLRFFVTAVHTDEQLLRTVDAVVTELRPRYAGYRGKHRGKIRPYHSSPTTREIWIMRPNFFFFHVGKASLYNFSPVSAYFSFHHLLSGAKSQWYSRYAFFPRQKRYQKYKVCFLDVWEGENIIDSFWCNTSLVSVWAIGPRNRSRIRDVPNFPPFPFF